MKLSEGKAIVLFRFHNDIASALERIKIIKHYNSKLAVYGLYGGDEAGYAPAKKALAGVAEHVWQYPEAKPARWKWFHTDLMTKAWFRDYGHTINFNFLYSYEYDLLTLKPLNEIYPDATDQQLVLAAVTKLNDVEWTWSWTGAPKKRPNWLAFKRYMHDTYGLEQQIYVCLGPGPLLPRTFLEQFSKTEDVEWMHEEATLPAYAEVFGFKLLDHGMHPGFTLQPEEIFFSCRSEEYQVSNQTIIEQLHLPDGRRTFHPVKQCITLDQILEAAHACK